MKLRAYHPADSAALLHLFRETVRRVNLGDYTQAQVEAWAPESPDLERWHRKLAQEMGVVAEWDNKIVGFCTWDATGYLDFLYVHHAHLRQGIATALYREAERAIRAAGLPLIHTQASLTAQPFFLKQGFRVVQHQMVHVRGEDLPNAVMEKSLPGK
jgi:GNAT superfamily N-acetyltransferase